MENKLNNNSGRLVEIKAGKTGYGLLVESDGYVSRDLTENNKKIIKEAFEKRDNGEWFVPNPFVLDVVLQKFGIENANKRIYPEAVLKREVEKYQKMIDERMALGQLNHPTETEIDLSRIAINVVECHWEGHTLVGKIEFNTTEGFRRYGICSSVGDEAVNLIMNGYKIGVSSRGIGSVKTVMGKTIVDSDFELICWDVVATPSTPGSYVGKREELLQYIESEQKDESKSKLNEKIDKVRSLLC
jgi:hypothetical protein